MLESYNTREPLGYNKLSPEEMKSRGILGRLQGVIADGKNPTRNGRKYSTRLWQNVFNDKLVKEAIDNKLCLGELGHPEDRTETDMEKVCICLDGYPKLGDDGKLYGTFSILDTPNGRILNTLAKFGANIGVSSRGEGDLYTDDYGNECVQEDTYQFNCFDAVIIPAVETARMKYMTESLSGKQTLTEALNKEIENANDKDKQIMMETLKTLGLDETYTVDRNSEGNFEVADGSGNVVKEVTSKAAALNIANKLEFGEPMEDNGPDEKVDEPLHRPEHEVVNNESVMEELQEALSDNRKLSKELMDVQQTLSASNTREKEYQTQIQQLKEAIMKLTVNAKRASGLETRVTQLSEALQKSNAKVDELEALKTNNQKEKTSLTESISKKDSDLQKVTEQLSKTKEEYEEKERTLQEDLSRAKGTVTLLKEKLDSQSKLVEKYKKISNACVNKYIGSKAQMIGATSEEIKNRLPESYNFDDIDRVVEDLRKYKVNMSRLPFEVNNKSGMRVRTTKTNESFKPSNPDDDDLSSLYSLAGLSK